MPDRTLDKPRSNVPRVHSAVTKNACNGSASEIQRISIYQHFIRPQLRQSRASTAYKDKPGHINFFFRRVHVLAAKHQPGRRSYQYQWLEARFLHDLVAGPASTTVARSLHSWCWPASLGLAQDLCSGRFAAIAQPQEHPAPRLSPNFFGHA